MKKDEFAMRVASVLRDKKARKPVKAQKSVFHISDDEGNSKAFAVTAPASQVAYTIEDVRVILDTAIQVIEELICRGDELSVRGFGTLGVKYREARKTKVPGTEDWVDIQGHYTPKFIAGNTLKMCAKIYELSMGDRDPGTPLPPPSFDEEVDTYEFGDES